MCAHCVECCCIPRLYREYDKNMISTWARWFFINVMFARSFQSCQNDQGSGNLDSRVLLCSSICFPPRFQCLIYLLPPVVNTYATHERPYHLCLCDFISLPLKCIKWWLVLRSTAAISLAIPSRIEHIKLQTFENVPFCIPEIFDAIPRLDAG